VHGRGLDQLALDVRQYFADDLPALLRDERGLPASSWCVDGGIKQQFFEELRDNIFWLLDSLAEPHRARLLIQAAEDIIDPSIEQANRRAATMMSLLKKFVRDNDYLLSDRQNKACCLIINSSTISETVRDCAIELIEENATQIAKAQAAALPPSSYTRTMACMAWGEQEDGLTFHSITRLMDPSKSFEELRFEDYCRANATADSVDPNQEAGSLLE
tara:strand:- start:672 stop:1322 length:651 start_codon:yes stop_codon:yes gene_type:complete